MIALTLQYFTVLIPKRPGIKIFTKNKFCELFVTIFMQNIKKSWKYYLGIDLQTWDIYVPLGFIPINIHKSIDCHLENII